VYVVLVLFVFFILVMRIRVVDLKFNHSVYHVQIDVYNCIHTCFCPQIDFFILYKLVHIYLFLLFSYFQVCMNGIMHTDICCARNNPGRTFSPHRIYEYISYPIPWCSFRDLPHIYPAY
jgi:hypothetical protein